MHTNLQTTALSPLSDKWGQNFAKSWLEAWNSHDVDRVLEHYADDFVMISPTIKEIAAKAEGILIGKSELRELCSKTFNEVPELKFELMAVAIGIKSLTIYYTSKEFQLVIEVMEFDEIWKISKSHSHY
jgi:hypothetical protein